MLNDKSNQVSDCRIAFLQGVYQSYPRIQFDSFKTTNLDLVRDIIEDCKFKLVNLTLMIFYFKARTNNHVLYLKSQHLG